MRGGDGNDVILGERGVDKLHREDGDDWIYSNAVNSMVKGGGGSKMLILV